MSRIAGEDYLIPISIVYWIAKPVVYFGNVISTHLRICWISPTQFGITMVVLQYSVEKSLSRKRVLLLKESLDIYSNVSIQVLIILLCNNTEPELHKSLPRWSAHT
jgi:hypothetical protein